MSAFVVSKTHIDAMVTAGLRLALPGTPLRWLWPSISTEDEGAYAVGEPWGPDSVRLVRERRHELTRETAERVGAMLWAENVRSVNHRYEEDHWEEVYQFDELGLDVDPRVVIGAVSCYAYQSCEHPEWESSEAHAFCRALERAAVSKLCAADNTWEITDPGIFGNRVRALF